MASSDPVPETRLIERLRSVLIPVVLVGLSCWLLIARDPLPLWASAQKAVPAIVRGGPVEQTGERGELNELIELASSRGEGPVLFVVPKASDHVFRAFFASYALFPRRVVFAAPDPRNLQHDSWTQCELTAPGIRQLAEQTGAEVIIFWKTPVPPGFEAEGEVTTLPDERWLVVLG